MSDQDTQEPIDYKAARATLRIAAAVGYDVDEELRLLDESEEAERAAREAADAELQQRLADEALDDADEAAGNSRGMSRAIAEVRRQRNQRRDLRKASPEMIEAFQRYDEDREAERKSDQRRRSPMKKGYEELTAFEVDKQRQQKAQQRRDDFYANRDKRRNDFTEFLNAERERRR